MIDRAEIHDVGAAARSWWKRLAGAGADDDGRSEGKRRDRAAFAELRRSFDPIELIFVPAFSDLRRSLRFGEKRIRQAAMIAHVLAHVRSDDTRAVARALGARSDEGSPAMSEQRFRRLLQARDDPDLARHLVRAVRLLKGKANVADIATAIRHWNDRTRQRWAFAFFDAEPPDQVRKTMAPHDQERPL
jgi:CRISPR type I-E-associated protein CasB/Cse2